MWSNSISEAEQTMTARIRELGGDTLLLGPGRDGTGNSSKVPDKIAERRDELLVSVPSTRRQRRDVADSPNQVEIILGQGKHVFYGAALRCSPS